MTSPFDWKAQPSALSKHLQPSNKDRSKEAAAKRYSPAIEGAAAGQRSADRRDALRRGGR